MKTVLSIYDIVPHSFASTPWYPKFIEHKTLKRKPTLKLFKKWFKLHRVIKLKLYAAKSKTKYYVAYIGKDVPDDLRIG